MKRKELSKTKTSPLKNPAYAAVGQLFQTSLITQYPTSGTSACRSYGPNNFLYVAQIQQIKPCSQRTCEVQFKDYLA